MVYDTDLVTFPVTSARPVILHDAGTRTVTITLAADALFAPGSAAIDPTADSALTESLDEIAKDKPTAIAVAGYTDTVPGPNQVLSDERAADVGSWLAAHFVDSALITTKDYGPSDPVASNDDAAGRAANRRVVITLSESR